MKLIPPLIFSKAYTDMSKKLKDSLRYSVLWTGSRNLGNTPLPSPVVSLPQVATKLQSREKVLVRGCEKFIPGLA